MLYSALGNQTISNAATYGNLTVSGSGTKTLSGATSVNGTLALTGADVTTGAFALTQPTTAPASTGSGDVVGTVIRSGALGNGTTYTFGNPSNQITANGGTGGTPRPTSVSVKLVKSAPSGKTGAVTRTYTVTPTGGTGYTTTLRLHYLDELNGNAETTLELWHLSGA